MQEDNKNTDEAPKQAKGLADYIMMPPSSTPVSQNNVMMPKSSTPTSQSNVMMPPSSTPVSQNNVMMPKSSTPTSQSNVMMPPNSTPPIQSGVMMPKSAIPASQSNVMMPPSSTPVSQHNVMMPKPYTPSIQSGVMMPPSSTPAPQSTVRMPDFTPASQNNVMMPPSASPAPQNNVMGSQSQKEPVYEYAQGYGQQNAAFVPTTTPIQVREGQGIPMQQTNPEEPSVNKIPNYTIEEINKTIPFSVRQKSFEEIIEGLKCKLENDITQFRRKCYEVYKLDEQLIEIRNNFLKNVRIAEEEKIVLDELDENIEFYSNQIEHVDLKENNLIKEIETLNDEIYETMSKTQDEENEIKRLVDENLRLIGFIDSELSKRGY